MKFRTATLIGASVLMLGVFLLDYKLGSDFDLWVMYLLPIGLLTVAIGPSYGYAMTCGATGLLWLNVILLGGQQGATAPLVFDLASELLNYLLFVFLIGLLRHETFSTRPFQASQWPAGQDQPHDS